MPIKRLTPGQIESIRSDLATLGVGGSALLAIPTFKQTADSHSYIREITLAFLRAVFRNMPDDIRWDAEPTKTKIMIRYADPRLDKEKGFTPALTVELTPFQWGNHAINNFLFQEGDGTRHYTDLRNGAVVIRCRDSVKLGADSLAHVVMGAFKYFHEELEHLSGFTWIDAVNANPSSGELNQSNVAGEFFVATVVVNVHYQESWKKSPSRFITGPVIFNTDPRGNYLD